MPSFVTILAKLELSGQVVVVALYVVSRLWTEVGVNHGCLKLCRQLQLGVRGTESVQMISERPVGYRSFRGRRLAGRGSHA